MCLWISFKLVKACSEGLLWYQLLDTPTTLRGGVNECGALFPKTSLLHKTHQLAFNIYSFPISIIYNQLDVGTYQQYIINKSSSQWTQRTQDVCTIFLFIMDLNKYQYVNRYVTCQWCKPHVYVPCLTTTHMCMRLVYNATCILFWETRVFLFFTCSDPLQLAIIFSFIFHYSN